MKDSGGSLISKQQALQFADGGESPTLLNPSFAEKIMGFPSMWTELDASEMQSFLKLHNSSVKQSQKWKNEKEVC